MRIPLSGEDTLSALAAFKRVLHASLGAILDKLSSCLSQTGLQVPKKLTANVHLLFPEWEFALRRVFFTCGPLWTKRQMHVSLDVNVLLPFKFAALTSI